MSERYSKLFALPENLYAEGAPVVISAGALLKDNQTSKVLAQFKFKNISQKQIKALKIKIKAFDVYGVQLEDITEYQYLDLSAPRDSEFGQKQAIPLPNNVTRSISCEVVSAVFVDSATWENTGAQWKPIAPQEALTNRLGGLAPQYQRDTVARAQFVIADERDLWLCACGAINGQIEAKCHACGSKKEALITALDIEKLTQHKAVFDKEEAEKNAKNAEEQKKKKAKTKKIGIITGVAAVIVIAALLVITMVIVPSGNYNSAVALMNDGKYEEAITAFKEMGDYKDASAKIDECKNIIEEQKNEGIYQQAIGLFDGKKYDEANELFLGLDNYKDSADKAKECTFQKAFNILEFGGASNIDIKDYYEGCETAYSLLSSIGTYKNADEFVANNFKYVKIKAELIWEKGMPPSANSEEYYLYDGKGNCTYEAQGYGGRMLITPQKMSSSNHEFEYDNDGNVIRMHYEGTGDVHTVNYEYGHILIVPD